MTRIRLPTGESEARATRLFGTARALMALARPADQPAPPSFARLCNYGLDPDAGPDPELEHAIATNPRIARDYRRLIERAARFRVPRVAAASTGRVVSERRFPRGRLRLLPSAAEPGQVYLVVDWGEGDPPRLLAGFLPEGGQCRRRLPAARGGVIQVLLDRSDPDDARLIEAVERMDTELFLT